MTYRPGDQVICIDDFYSVYLVKGKIYTVSDIIPNEPRLMFVIEGLIPYSKARFIPKNATKLERLICGYND